MTVHPALFICEPEDANQAARLAEFLNNGLVCDENGQVVALRVQNQKYPVLEEKIWSRIGGRIDCAGFILQIDHPEPNTVLDNLKVAVLDKTLIEAAGYPYMQKLPPHFKAPAGKKPR